MLFSVLSLRILAISFICYIKINPNSNNFLHSFIRPILVSFFPT